MAFLKLLLLLLPLVALIVSQATSKDAVQGAFYKKIRNGGLLVNVLFNESVSSVMECSQRCLRIHNCTGFNYKSSKIRNRRNCQLSDGNKKYIQQTSNSKEWTLYKSIKINAFKHTSCPDGWLKRFSSCYFFASVSLPWNEARSSCQNLGGDLHVPDDDTEQQEIWRVFTSRTPPLERHWIGLRYRSDAFYTVHDVQASYLYFFHPEPNNLGFEHCVEIKERSGQWNNLSCGYRRRYICERNQIVTHTSRKPST